MRPVTGRIMTTIPLKMCECQSLKPVNIQEVRSYKQRRWSGKSEDSTQIANQGWGCSSVVESLPSIHKTLDSIPRTMGKKVANHLTLNRASSIL
jgi:hypothetical protein